MIYLLNDKKNLIIEFYKRYGKIIKLCLLIFRFFVNFDYIFFFYWMKKKLILKKFIILLVILYIGFIFYKKIYLLNVICSCDY